MGSPLLTETLKSQLTTIEKQLTTAKQPLEKNKKKKMLDLSPQKAPTPKHKEEAKKRCRRGTTMTKSNPIAAGWPTHKLENNNTKEFLQLL